MSELTVGRDYEEERDYYLKELDVQVHVRFYLFCRVKYKIPILFNFSTPLSSSPDAGVSALKKY